MKISGFAMVKNAGNLYFPIRESILSILPIVDEYIVALGDCAPGDTTLESIQSINSDKIKIFHRTWSEESFVDGRIFAEETNFALSQCTGDWCFYLQADEVVHERDLPVIQNACGKELNNKSVDGFLFKYHHFWGDYDHHLPFHGWYKNEIRIIRNHAGIRSFKDAQSFRKEDDSKLFVRQIDAWIYHYGWVRPPGLMQKKRKEQSSMHHGRENANETYKKESFEFDFGALGRVPFFKGTHPSVMKSHMEKMSWKPSLNYGKKTVLRRGKVKHEKIKYRIISLIENWFNGGRTIVGYSNWHILKK